MRLARIAHPEGVAFVSVDGPEGAERVREIEDHPFGNPTYTSSRRLTRGVLYGFFVTLLVYYLLGYVLNRTLHRTVIGSAPAFRGDRSRRSRRLQTSGVALLGLTVAVLVVRMS